MAHAHTFYTYDKAGNPVQVEPYRPVDPRTAPTARITRAPTLPSDPRQRAETLGLRGDNVDLQRLADHRYRIIQEQARKIEALQGKPAPGLFWLKVEYFIMGGVAILALVYFLRHMVFA